MGKHSAMTAVWSNLHLLGSRVATFTIKIYFPLSLSCIWLSVCARICSSLCNHFSHCVSVALFLALNLSLLSCSFSTLTHIAINSFFLSLSKQCHICYEPLLSIKLCIINNGQGGLEVQRQTIWGLCLAFWCISCHSLSSSYSELSPLQLNVFSPISCPVILCYHMLRLNLELLYVCLWKGRCVCMKMWKTVNKWF